jgi:hypothetical protein
MTMPQFQSSTPEEKKVILLQLIDDMTASALDHRAQGYNQFLQYRNNLIQLIDTYALEDKKHVEFARSMFSKFDEYFPSK